MGIEESPLWVARLPSTEMVASKDRHQEKPGISTESLTTAPPPWFESYFRRHHKDLLRTAMYAGVRNIEEADDVVAQVMTDELKRGRLDSIRSPHGYFQKAVKNLVFTMHKARRRKPDPIALMDDLRESDFRNEITKWEEEQDVETLFDVLSPAQREIMEMVYEGFSTLEIAEYIAKPPATVRSNLRHARARLEQELQLRSQIPPQSPSISTSSAEGAQ